MSGLRASRGEKASFFRTALIPLTFQETICMIMNQNGYGRDSQSKNGVERKGNMLFFK